MKRKLTLLLTAFVLGYCNTNAQYTATVTTDAEALLAELAGDGVTVLNPVLTCRDSFAATFSGSDGLDFDNGIMLSTIKAPEVFTYFDYTIFSLGVAESDMYNPITAEDQEMNNLLDFYGDTLSEAYNTCKIDFDVIPQAKTLNMEFAFTSNLYTGFAACEPLSDIIGISISGGVEYLDTTNLALFPETDLRVNTWTLTADSADINMIISSPHYCPLTGFELIPHDDFAYINYDGTYTNNVHYELISKQMPISATVSPCDTYHITVAIADVRRPLGHAGYHSPQPSTFFLKSGSLRTTGQPEDCPTTVDPEPPSSLNEYLKQQAAIKVSPNPFSNSIAIAIQNDNDKELYNVGLYDIAGRLLSQTKGNLKEVNANLGNVGNELAIGMYLLKIQSVSGKYNHTVKVVKD